MEIYLVRHGIAEDVSASGEDSDRRLTPAGLEKASRVARLFTKKVADMDFVFHSPYVRARETAKIFAALYPEAILKEAKGLTPFDKARMALPLLSELGHGKKVMLVGHEPHLSSLASLLITGSERPVMEFRKAGIAGISCSGKLDQGYLMFLLSPKFMA